MSLPSNLIFLVLLGVASPLYAQKINDAPNITNQKPENKVKSTIIPGWEDSAAIAFLVLLAVIIVTVPLVIILIRIRRKNRKARRLTSRGAPGTAGNASQEEHDYEMGLRDSQTDTVVTTKGKENWTLQEIEVYMRGGDPNKLDSFPPTQASSAYRPSTSTSVQPQQQQQQQQPVAAQSIADAAQAKPVGISRATSVKVTKVKAITVVKAGRGGDGSTLGGASVASSPRRPEAVLMRSE
ncbi:hypothetical protein BJ508DRAFT_166530 [Ascobolus immersus RN42]|uniref:Uncharacterized protein n=1 Tax=Ascobolus immersus RN42 TaxID=1160509 RepID=A0A3N4INH0_ASCIM|nr:hypothetical protein BJ508DRAFT_166530 [Ascobolus immersus RN42]